MLRPEKHGWANCAGTPQVSKKCVVLGQLCWDPHCSKMYDVGLILFDFYILVSILQRTVRGETSTLYQVVVSEPRKPVSIK